VLLARSCKQSRLPKCSVLVLIYLLHDGQSARDEDCICVVFVCFLIAVLHVQDKLEELRLLKAVKVTLEQATKAQRGSKRFSFAV